LINLNLPKGLYLKNIKVGVFPQEKRKTIGSLLKATAWKYEFISKPSYSKAVDILKEYSDFFIPINVTEAVDNSSGNEIELLEKFSGSSGKTISFFKILKENSYSFCFQNKNIESSSKYFSAKRIGCYGYNERNGYDLLQNIL